MNVTLSSEESTLLSDSRTDGRTDADADIPEHYASVRVTCPHIDMKRMLQTVFDTFSYICYPHKGAKTHKEHCHVLIPTNDPKDRDKIKSRLNRAGYTGNESFSVKGMHNGILQGIQYAAKEGTSPIVHGDLVHLIDLAPKWTSQTSIHSHYSSKSSDKPEKLRDWQLNYTNLVAQAVHYSKVNKLGDMTLKQVVKDMIRTTKWRPCKQMYCSGVPDAYSKDFEFRMGHRSEPDMDWFCQRD